MDNLLIPLTRSIYELRDQGYFMSIPRRYWSRIKMYGDPSIALDAGRGAIANPLDHAPTKYLLFGKDGMPCVAGMLSPCVSHEVTIVVVSTF